MEKFFGPSAMAGGDAIVVCSQTMKQVLAQADKLRREPDVPVLIVGETGTGKELLARYIHSGWGGSSTSPFVAVNCAAISPTLFEAELFGYEPGAFTGGLPKGQRGKFDLAGGGTLFLDEIAEIPVNLQAKLLRVLQEREFYRVGGVNRIKTTARVVCATNADIPKKIEEGAFRPDLYYRLSVAEIHIPPLREREEEIIPLAEHFLLAFSRQKGKSFRRISDAAADILLSYDWPGNVRELKNLIEWAVLMHDGEELKPCHIQPKLRRQAPRPPSRESAPQAIDWREFRLPEGKLPLKEYVDNIVLKALEMHGGNVAKTAEYLGISRRSFYGRFRDLLESSRFLNHSPA